MKYRSDILETIHENATANFKIGAISEARMREYDEMCLGSKTEASVESNSAQRTESTEEIEHISFVAV